MHWLDLGTVICGVLLAVDEGTMIQFLLSAPIV